MHTKQDMNESGYTLLEVLAAMFILVVLITPLFFQLGQGLKGQQLQDEVLQLSIMAKGYLEQLRGEYETGNRLISQKTITGPNQGEEGDYSWQVNWTLISAGEVRGIYEVTVIFYKAEEDLVTAKAFITTRLMGEL